MTITNYSEEKSKKLRTAKITQVVGIHMKNDLKLAEL